MADVFDPLTRSRLMAGIKSKNTSLELSIRKGLHRLGFRYHLHNKELPGSPDLVLTKYRSVIFVNGCFWHGHHCHIFHLPSTRLEYWQKKIQTNKLRDQRNITACNQKGWKVLILKTAVDPPHRANR